MGCLNSLLPLYPDERKHQCLAHGDAVRCTGPDPTTAASSQEDLLEAGRTENTAPPFRTDGRLPTGSFGRLERPSSICQSCWEGLFLAHLGLLSERIRMTWKDKTVTGGYSYSSSWADLEYRANGGCLWCQLVWGTREDDDDSKSSGSLNIVVGTQACLTSNGSTPQGTQDLSVFVNGTLRFLGYVYAHTDDPAGAYIVARIRVLDVGSPRSLTLAKACLEECVHGHGRCIPPAANPRPLLPTRLIDCTDPGRPRLSSTDGARGTYVALSYVWGEAQPHSTTKSNISTYACGIDPQRLPSTIRDAINVTHALGIQYLWADTLCIIQDSSEDKQREIGRMRLIYRDAYFTIIAASAARVSEGFLQDRLPAPPAEYGVFSRDVTLPFVCPCSQSGPARDVPPQVGEVRISPIWRYPDPPQQPLAQYNPASEPISTRGWCMQEYLMSTRALLFASHTLQYRCQTATQNVGGAYHDSFYERRLPDVLFLADSSPVELRSEEWETVREAWREVLAEYTQRSISVPSDKLVAWGGIAEEFARVLRSEYLAGLWRDTLLADLLWSKRAGASVSRPVAYRAPSWSWAAVDGRIEAGAMDVRPRKGTNVAEVVQCEVTLQHAALPYGEVTAATLILRTPLIRCAWNLEEPNHLLRLPSVEEMRDRISSLDDEDEMDVERIGIGYLDSEDDNSIQGVWVAPIHWDDTLMAGLVLERMESQADPASGRTYRRIGMYNSHATAGPTGWVREVPLVEIEVL
ncbi:HET-domain-containing protein [Pilatotrama ljubarskyi]|nr:HET-domain-containing protein [Pilatotrama ljubarskyi]